MMSFLLFEEMKLTPETVGVHLTSYLSHILQLDIVLDIILFVG